VFPKSTTESVTKGPIDLVWCPDSGLLQLKQSYHLAEMYGENYGYRSGLNISMVDHLHQKAYHLAKFVGLKAGDTVLDIGSNDATFLKAFPVSMHKIGVDPTGDKFSAYYGQEISLVADFFSATTFLNQFPHEQPKLITSIAMFYDIESPSQFVKDIEVLLAPDGIWHFEQSYMPSMLRTNAYDTICHEHLEFYSFQVVKSLIEAHGLKVIDVQMNSVNGGSFAVTAAKKTSTYAPNHAIINWLLNQEEMMNLYTLAPFRAFEARIFKHRTELLTLIENIVASGKTVFGYGASTKGNVLLQFCGITKELLPYMAEVNPSKYGCYTPGTHIPIISEREAMAMKPDYFLVLPWHFKHHILEKEKDYLQKGGKFVFPLSEIEIV